MVHTSSKYGHPTNWAGYMLVGKDIVLRDRSVELAQSVQMMVQAPLDHLLGTLRTLQAMVSVCVCVCVCVLLHLNINFLANRFSYMCYTLVLI